MQRLTTALSAAFVIAIAGAGSGAMAQETEPEEQAREEAREARVDRASDRFCIQETGSRVVASRNARSRSERAECVAAGGRVYTREEIERTGATDIRDALRRLDPSLR